MERYACRLPASEFRAAASASAVVAVLAVASVFAGLRAVAATASAVAASSFLFSEVVTFFHFRSVAGGFVIAGCFGESLAECLGGVYKFLGLRDLAIVAHVWRAQYVVTPSNSAVMCFLPPRPLRSTIPIFCRALLH